jgi:hypothetical protein
MNYELFSGAEFESLFALKWDVFICEMLEALANP